MIVWGEEMKNRKIKKNRRGEIYMNKLLITVRKKKNTASSYATVKRLLTP